MQRDEAVLRVSGSIGRCADSFHTIAIRDVLLYIYTLDEWQDGIEEAKDRLAALQFRHQRPLESYPGRKGNRRKVFVHKTP